jgi:hypothetical protein
VDRGSPDTQSAKPLVASTNQVALPDVGIAFWINFLVETALLIKNVRKPRIVPPIGLHARPALRLPPVPTGSCIASVKKMAKRGNTPGESDRPITICVGGAQQAL